MDKYINKPAYESADEFSTIQDCIDKFEKEDKTSLIKDGKLIGFINE